MLNSMSRSIKYGSTAQRGEALKISEAPNDDDDSIIHQAL